MTATDRFDRELLDWLEREAEPRLPAYTDDFLARVARTRQRPRWSIPERWLPMTSLTLAPVSRVPRTATIFVVVGLLATLALVAGLLLAGQRRVPPPFGPAANGALAFAEDGHIVVVNPDGSGRHVLAVGDGTDTPLAWSRDGTRIALVRETGTQSHLFALDSDGSDLIQLSADPVFASSLSLSWSPDGGRIAYSTDAHGIPRLFVADSRGGGTAAILPDLAISQVSWSPDGHWLLFRVADTASGEYSLQRAHPDGSGLQVLYADCGPTFACGSAWSPDGRRIAFFAGASPINRELMRLHVMNADGSGDRILGSPADSSSDFYPDWSPDGRLLQFFSTRDGGPYRLFLVDPDGGTAPVAVGAPFTTSSGVAWSPDGHTLLQRVDDTGETLVLDPAGGPGRPAPFELPAFPTWQRLAP